MVIGKDNRRWLYSVKPQPSQNIVAISKPVAIKPISAKSRNIKLSPLGPELIKQQRQKEERKQIGPTDRKENTLPHVVSVFYQITIL
jgi:hypothetical protein